MIWLMEILKISIEEQLLTNYYVIKHLILVKIQNMAGISVGLSEWFINFLIKKLLVEQITMKSLLTLAEELADELQKGFRFSLCVIDIYSKSACVVLMKDK